MKRIRFMTPAALALAACLSLPLSTNAQEAPPEVKAMIWNYTLGSPEGLPMEEAVKQLLDTADTNGIPVPNILFDDAARTALVPELALQNVSVADALQLIAVSADCELLPILSAESAGVIGYRFLMPAGGGGFVSSGPGGGIPAAATMPAAPEEPTAPDGTGGAPLVPPPGWPSSEFDPRPRSRAMVFTAPAGQEEVAPGIATNVYALGPVVGGMKLEDIEQALLELLEMQGGGKDTASLRIHEATNTLIVRSTPAEQELVTRMLSALAENQAAKEAIERRNNESLAVARARDLEMTVRELTNQTKRLEAQLAESEAEKAQLKQMVNELGMELGKGRSSGDAKSQ